MFSRSYLPYMSVAFCLRSPQGCYGSTLFRPSLCRVLTFFVYSFSHVFCSIWGSVWLMNFFPWLVLTEYLHVIMETKGGKKSKKSSIQYESPLGYGIEDVRPHGGSEKFRTAAYSNVRVFNNLYLHLFSVFVVLSNNLEPPSLALESALFCNKHQTLLRFSPCFLRWMSRYLRILGWCGMMCSVCGSHPDIRYPYWSW